MARTGAAWYEPLGVSRQLQQMKVTRCHLPLTRCVRNGRVLCQGGQKPAAYNTRMDGHRPTDCLMQPPPGLDGGVDRRRSADSV